jgi:4-oxalocrotonate tautomerase
MIQKRVKLIKNVIVVVKNTWFSLDADMPYINVKVAGKLTQKQRKDIVTDITKTMLKVAGKPASSTYVQIDEVPRNQWGVGGKMLSEK